MIDINCILIIDDEPDIREIAKLSLQITKDWHVLTAATGQAGFNLAMENHPDVILLDLTMPEQDGFATLRLLRKNPITQNIPVLLLTATSSAIKQITYGPSTAQGALLKPFDPGTLGDQIEMILTCWER
jgi:DNA-binding response OmpR family regulator